MCMCAQGGRTVSVVFFCAHAYHLRCLKGAAHSDNPSYARGDTVDGTKAGLVCTLCAGAMQSSARGGR
jgi:hypothetical protein